MERSSHPNGVNFHPTFFAPIPDLPVEDVDAVEVSNAAHPEMFVWPTTSFVHFFDGVPAGLTVSIPTLTPGVSGCDFVANPVMSMGVYQTLGWFYMYDLTLAIPGLTASGPLPGLVPQRRDIDPFIFADPLSPSGESAIFSTGNGLHCRTLPAGLVRWDIILPSVMAEAVDPVISPNGNLWAPCMTALVKIDPIAGAIISVVPNFGGSAPVREVDLRFSGAPLGPGPSAAWFPIAGFLTAYDDGPGTPALPAIAGPFGIPPLIEGNDLEWNPTLTLGYLPTLPVMLQINVAPPGIAAGFALAGFPHQRNQDAVFNPTGAGPPKWVYAMQGAMVIGDNFLGAGPPVFLPNPGVTYDGVDPSFSDTPPAPIGQIVSIATSSGTNVYNAPGVALLGSCPRTPGSGPLRTDADHKPGPMFGNFLVQPTTTGLLSIGGFGPNDWVVSLANGVEVVDIAALVTVHFMTYAAMGAPGALTYRGGDAQPSFFSPGVPEPAYSVDNPDQDFVTKCWEYKYAMNRWPYWYSRTMPNYYPHYVPYGVFGPPPLVGWDILNQDQVVLTTANQVAILSDRGLLLHTIPLPAPARGGIIWDWDNKRCKIRCQGQIEAVFDLTPLGYGSPPAVSIATFGSFTRWYPIVDRMNGWEFAIRRGGRQIWVYDHYANVTVATLSLPARCIRRPIFDDQRKVLCIPLADRTCAFFNAHAYRTGKPPAQYLYYSPVLPAQICDTPVFDIYNHYTICPLMGSQLCVLDNSNGTLKWSSGMLPYLPTCPIQVDCYNKVAKGFYRNAAATQYYEMVLDLYPLIFGTPPVPQWITLTGIPFGYPQFDSMDGFEIYRLGTNVIEARSLTSAAVFSVITPLAIKGNLFIDRINKYALCALAGPSIFYIDLHKFTTGMPGATQTINFPYPPTAQTTDDIVFVSQLRKALIHVDNPPATELVALDLVSATPFYYPALSGLSPIRRQMYAHPFRSVVTYPYAGGEITIDLTPTTWSPPSPPSVLNQPLGSPPIDAVDFSAPVAPFLVSQLPPQPGDAPTVVHFQVSGLEPGATIFADKNPPDPPFGPTEDTADDDGIADGISIIADSPEQICFTQIDPAGNAGPAQCVALVPTSVSGKVPDRLSFVVAGENPARDRARFRLGLPSAGRVKVGIYDVTGRFVATVVDRDLDAGTHDFAWDLSGGTTQVSSGIYFARVRTQLGEATARVTVIQ